LSNAPEALRVNIVNAVKKALADTLPDLVSSSDSAAQKAD